MRVTRANNMDEECQKITEHVQEALRISGSKERYSGVVDSIDAPSGTTAIIRSGDRTFLAFCKSEGVQILFEGQRVEFRISGMRAVDVQVVEAEAPASSETIAQEHQDV